MARGTKPRRGVVAGVVVLLLAVGGLSACTEALSSDTPATDSSDVSSPAGDGAADATDDGAASPEATPSPTSPTIVEADYSGRVSDQAAAELIQEGMRVTFADASGNVLPSAPGWSVIGETPPAGTALTAGSSVQLILSPPAPPPAPAPAPAPAPEAPASGATAKCNDGTLSYSAHHQGTCSHHGGVAEWYR